MIGITGKKYPCIKEKPLIRLKITDGGTQVSRSMHILLIAFTILVGLENPNSPGGNHVIAILILRRTMDTYQKQ